MKTITTRCDIIIALIDDCLAEQSTTVPLVSGDFGDNYAQLTASSSRRQE